MGNNLKVPLQEKNSNREFYAATEKNFGRIINNKNISNVKSEKQRMFQVHTMLISIKLSWNKLLLAASLLYTTPYLLTLSHSDGDKGSLVETCNTPHHLYPLPPNATTLVQQCVLF